MGALPRKRPVRAGSQTNSRQDVPGGARARDEGDPDRPRPRQPIASPDITHRVAATRHFLGGSAPSLPSAAAVVAGLPAHSPACYFAAANRMARFHRTELDYEILELRSLLRVPGPRGELTLVPPPLVPVVLALTPRAKTTARLRALEIDGGRFHRLSERIGDALSRAAHTTEELAQIIDGFPQEAIEAVVWRMAEDGRVIHSARRGGLRSRRHELVLLDDWLPVTWDQPDRDSALRLLAQLWLDARGPTTAAELAAWSGVPEVLAAETLEDIARPVAADGSPQDGGEGGTDEPGEGEGEGGRGGALYATESFIRACEMPHPDPGVQLLAAGDPYLRGNGNAVMAGGMAVGTWALSGHDLSIDTDVILDDALIHAAVDRLRGVVPIDRVEQRGPGASG